MNILHDDISDVTNAIYARLGARRHKSCVYVRGDGLVAMCRQQDDLRRSRPLPEEELVGVYDHKVDQDVIKGDLLQRREELGMGRLAA